jgi:hypothetical protein
LADFTATCPRERYDLLVADTPLQIAFDNAQRSIADQRARVDNVRARAATLLSAAAIVTSFLGAEALRDTRLLATAQVANKSLQLWELIAIGTFAGVVVSVLFILLPRRRKWRFRLKGDTLLAEYVDANLSLEDTQRALIQHLEQHYRSNDILLARLFWALQLSALLLGVEVAAWIADLTGA